MKKLTILIFTLAFIFGGTAYADENVMCAQVITFGQNPETLEWEMFPTPCDVPEGWETSISRPIDEEINPGYDGTGKGIEGDIMPLITPYTPDGQLLPEPYIAPFTETKTADYTLTEDDNGSTLTLKTGETVRVILESNPTTGYNWAVKALDQDILENTYNSYASDCSDEEVAGCGGKEEMNFMAIAAGETTLELLYYRPWEEESSAINTFTLKTTVSGDPVSRDEIIIPDDDISESGDVARPETIGIVPVPNYTFTDADDGNAVSMGKGESLRIALESNPTTGYKWNVKVSEQDILKNRGNDYTSECEDDVMGCGGKEAWDFMAVAPGTATLEMLYYRGWEGESSATKTFTLNVSVSETATDTELIGRPTDEDPVDIIPIMAPVSSSGDCNGDGVIDREDVREKRKENDKTFKIWKKECWKAEKACGDYNGDGVTDKKDLKEKKADLDRSLKTWKKERWDPEMKLQFSRANNLAKKAQVSECGGFDAEEKEAVFATRDANCRGEKLTWKYNEASQTVTFLNENVWLNCCGERSATVSLNENTGVYQIYETDNPEDVGRCRCMCFFDFQVKLPDITSETIRVKVSRFISDSEKPMSVVWKGELNLSKGSGETVIQENVGWCADEPTCGEKEICGNGADDNCDGLVDEGCGEPCGGIEGLVCPDGQFCLYPQDTCNWADNMGVCTTVPEACIELYAPVCGCDGKTYANDCFMMMAGQSKDHDGECE